jgi:hypothetical protein
MYGGSSLFFSGATSPAIGDTLGDFKSTVTAFIEIRINILCLRGFDYNTGFHMNPEMKKCNKTLSVPKIDS